MLNQGQQLNERILVAEDDPAMRKLVVSALVDAGYEVYPAADGRQALDIARAVPQDMLLLDVGMPVFDGFEVVSRLRNEHALADSPVIFLSGRDREQDVVAGLELGAVDYVTKPVEPAVLLARVRNHLRLARLTRSLEFEVQERTRELRELNDSLREAQRQLREAGRKERERLATCIHDQTLQQLAVAADAVERDPALTREMLQTSASDLRSLIFELSPSELFQFGLAAALERLAEEASRRWETRFSFSGVCGRDQVDSTVAVLVFECVRELVHNVGKHAAARQAHVLLRLKDQQLDVTVVDDGRGFSGQEQTPRSEGGFGLNAVRQRLADANGQLIIEDLKPGALVRILLFLGEAEHEVGGRG